MFFRPKEGESIDEFNGRFRAIYRTCWLAFFVMILVDLFGEGYFSRTIIQEIFGAFVFLYFWFAIVAFTWPCFYCGKWVGGRTTMLLGIPKKCRKCGRLTSRNS